MNEQEAMTELGRILQARREELGISQSKFAFDVGLHASHWGRIESGQNKPTIPVLVRAAQLLDLELGALEVLKPLDLRIPTWATGEESSR